MSKRVDTASKLIRASATVIYHAFATPQALEKWLPPQGMTAAIVAFSFREGGAYRMRLTFNGSQHAPGKTSHDTDEVEVRFVKLVPAERIEQLVTFDSDDAAFAGQMRMTWLLEPVAEGTLVTVRCEEVPVGIRPDDHQAGLQSTLDNLAVFAQRSVKAP